ncbi:hypothetical protein CPELA_05825 [Corynebacterium pelargi]|uniref:Uncharacterized protein n=1 Tax=Corynebacterium pelargi TaxID=1471400 RepID=A0A410W8Z7_9CORY|nr:hypothetical protein CPELA_05825 [Corynebacterium pelargi]
MGACGRREDRDERRRGAGAKESARENATKPVNAQVQARRPDCRDGESRDREHDELKAAVIAPIAQEQHDALRQGVNGSGMTKGKNENAFQPESGEAPVGESARRRA